MTQNQWILCKTLRPRINFLSILDWHLAKDIIMGPPFSIQWSLALVGPNDDNDDYSHTPFSNGPILYQQLPSLSIMSFYPCSISPTLQNDVLVFVRMHLAIDMQLVPTNGRHYCVVEGGNIIIYSAIDLWHKNSIQFQSIITQCRE